jgi:hypothetical protein
MHQLHQLSTRELALVKLTPGNDLDLRHHKVQVSLRE